MSKKEIHLGDIGTVIEVEVKTINSSGEEVILNVSSATTKQILFTPPKGVKKTKTAEFLTDGTDGILTYTTVADDLDEVGTWDAQPHVVLSSGTWSGSIERFEVYPNL